MNLPKVSIIVPVYNAEKYLRQCILNLVKQTYEEIEIICIDDGSEDNSLTILKELKQFDNRLIVFHQENKGVSAARNVGLREASGKYIMCCDADDFYDKNAVELCIKECLSHQYCDAVFYNARILEPNGNFHLAIYGDQYNNIPRSIQCDTSEYLGIFTTVWGGMLSIDIIRQYNITFREEHIYEDWEFLGHFLSRASKAAWLNKPLYNYRWDQAISISTDISPKCLDMFDTIELVESHYKETDRWNNVQFSHYIKALTHLIYFQRNRLPMASENVQNKFNEKLQEYVQGIPYIFLESVVHYIPMAERISILKLHNDADFEVRFCEQNLMRSKWHNFKLYIRSRIKSILMKFLPSYRVANHMREEMERMHWTLVAKLDFMIEKQRLLESEIDLLKKRFNINKNEQLINDIELEKNSNNFIED